MTHRLLRIGHKKFFNSQKSLAAIIVLSLLVPQFAMPVYAASNQEPDNTHNISILDFFTQLFHPAAKNLTISDSPTANAGTAPHWSTGKDGGNVNVEDINAALNAGEEVTIEAEGNIMIDGDIRTTNGTKAGLTLRTNHTIMVNSSLEAGDIHMNAKNILQQGTLQADTIRIKFTGAYIDREGSRTTAANIHLDGSKGRESHIFTSGSYDASGANGGDITFEAQNFVKLYGARLNANGTTRSSHAGSSGQVNGGTIKIGGDYKGQGTMKHAQETFISSTTELQANGDKDNGGTIVVWSDQSTTFQGKATAISNQGNGGIIEISSNNNLSVADKSKVDASSKNGTAGTVLFDPKNITISSGVTDPVGSVYYFELVDPNPDTGSFGGTSSITTLSTGNIVITDTGDDLVASNAGAVYLFNGANGALISTITGTTASDAVGAVTTLSDGDYVILTTGWDNGGVTDVGAATWCSGTTGCTGAVSTSNSLYGTTASDFSAASVTALTGNGNYVIGSGYWDNGAVVGAGAVTWCSGTTGCTGAVSTSNSLYGTTASDNVGYYLGNATIALTNGNYVVNSPDWTNGANANAGASTWCSGTTGCIGAVSTANSLYGSTVNDYSAADKTTIALTNGNYVVGSSYWHNGAIDPGAVTWCSGTIGCTGAISTLNSLYGSTSDDYVGLEFNGYPQVSGLVAFTNGNYLVGSSNWNNGATVDVGAITWCSGTTGCTGVVSTSNSLYGSSASDYVGLTSYRGGANGITILSNNNYVVSSRYWNNGATVDVGAATWGNGTTGTTGPVSTSNSLYNTTPGGVAGPTNGAGYPRVFALTNGNYVVGAYLWDNGATTDVGAVTWGNGTTGVAGAVSTSNSLYGSTASDNVGTSVTVLTNGNYVVYSSLWDNGGIANRGAVTWGNGTTGTTGAVTTSNSLYGSTASDGVGTSVTALTNGNYVVTSTTWDNGGIADRGAVTWGNGTTGITGAVSTSNSLYGSTASDKVGNVGFSNTIIALTNGNYVVGSRDWDNGGTADAGAATLCSGTAGCTGTISTANSILGPSASAGLGTIVEDTVNNHFIVPFATAQKVYSASSVLFDSAPNDYIFGYDPSASYTFTPGFLTAVLNTGSNVTLQANNDITISSAITASNGSGNGGVLTLQAGRSILINANITTDNGNLILYANEKASAGVIDANRSSGTAVITMAGGTVIDAGAGTVTIRMDDGTGNTNRTAGAITLTSITAGTLSVTNTNAGATDTISISPTITNFTLNSAGTFTLGAALTLTGNLTITAGTLDVSSAGCSGASCAVTVFGNWTNTAGTFTARTGTVTLNGAGQTISGSTTFYNLTKSITSADTLIFAAGTTQTITNTLTFNGAASNLLSLRSSSTPTQWSINPQGTRVIGYLDVKDSNNTNATAINMAGIHSVNSLNNTSWGFNTAPILISIADAPDPIKGGSTITITPTGHGDGESDALNFFCNETGSATGATTLCLQGSASTSGDYSSMTCTYAVATGNATRTIYCRAFDGTEYSAERTTTYTVDSIAPGLPSVSPIPAIYTSAQSVSLTAADSSIIYYTIDGSTPTISSTIYTTPVSVSVTTMIKAIAGDAVGNLSGVMSEVFTIQAASSSSASTPTGGGTRPATLERRQAEVKAPLPQTTEHAAALGVMIAPPAPANLPPLLINMRERMIQRMDVLVTKQPSLKAAMERVLQRLDARLAKRGRR